MTTKTTPKTDFEKIEERIDKTAEWLQENAPECFTEQKHTDEGTQERIYWHYGYLVALRDVINLFDGGSSCQTKQ